MFILLIWASIVTKLTNDTAIYQKCKNNDCRVVVKEVGYKIEVENNESDL
jgi:hypothetical protein